MKPAPVPAAPPPAIELPPEPSWEDLTDPGTPSLDVSLEDSGPLPELRAPPPPEPPAPPPPAPAELAAAAALQAAAPLAIELPDLGDEPELEPELAPAHAFVPPPEATGHQPEAPAAPATQAVPPAGDAGEALLREALSKASREVIERVVWEVVPQLAETIIRENLDRLVQRRQG